MTAADHKLNRSQERKCHLGKYQPDCQKQDRGGDYSNLFSTRRSQLETAEILVWDSTLKENIERENLKEIDTNRSFKGMFERISLDNSV